VTLPVVTRLPCGTVARMPYASNGDCKIYFETFGSPSDPTLLLVNGLGSQCINYKEAWCERFVAARFHVVRFDNRDVGLSTHFTDAPLDEKGAAYTMADMAADAIAVLDAIGVERAHVMGLSMGGMIVQHLAIHHRDRLLTMTSVMSRTGEPGYGEPTPEAWALLTTPGASDRESALLRSVAGMRLWGSAEFADEERWRKDAGEAYDRSNDPAGVARQFFAIGAAGSWADDLPEVTTPTLVMHGDKDTLIDISGGRRTAALIPGAKFVAIEGMGHDYPPELWNRWVYEVRTFCLG
jgi:pimeloyl-ACP methyl ester carboxylesterase